jgi:hypothetical protein
MTPRACLRGAIGSLLALLLAPTSARAANEAHPRTPVVWAAADCATVVDRSKQSIVHFDYTIPNEDAPATSDEVSDSRHHQFFAFRRLDYLAVANDDGLPRWITQADIDRAAEVDSMVRDDIMRGIDPAEILDGGTRFDRSDWVRITPDYPRVPITFDQAAMGVDWEVSAVEPGGWTIWGYTWEPTRNKWEVRAGFVKVIAGASEADAAGPAIALLEEDLPTVAAGIPYKLPGCADVPSGSTVTLEWGKIESGVEPEWCTALHHEPIETGMLDLDLVLPSAAAEPLEGADPDAPVYVKLRATVTDRHGHEYVAYSWNSYLAVANPDGETIVQECHPKEPRGCCSVAGGDLRETSLLMLVVIACRRRRRGVLFKLDRF